MDRPRRSAVAAEQSEPWRPWYQRWPGAVAVAAALLAGVVVALLAGHVIGGKKSQTIQSQVAATHTSASTPRASTVTHTATATATVTASQTQPPPASGALAAVDNYWNDIGTGDYSGAYSLLAPGSINQTESQFIAQHQAENITNVQFRGTVLSSNGTSATIGIVTLKTTDSANGCRNWSGQYQLSDATGSWLIGQASLTPSACA